MAVAVLVASVVWQRGPERVVDDVGTWAVHLVEVWRREYVRFESYSNQAQAARRR